MSNGDDINVQPPYQNRRQKKPEIVRSRAKSTKGGGRRRQPWHVGLRGPFDPSRRLTCNQSSTSDNCSLSLVFVHCQIFLLHCHKFVVRDVSGYFLWPGTPTSTSVNP